MGIFKKTIKYSKPSKDLDDKIKKLDEELKITGVIDGQNDSEILCVPDSSEENLPKIYDKLEVQKEEEILYNWRETFFTEENENVNEDDYESLTNKEYHRTIDKVENYISENNKRLIQIRDQVFQEISESTLLNLPEIKTKIEKVLEIYDQIQEGLLNEPPEIKNEDPLTPLNKNFVTTQELKRHYTLFINRVQEQLATVGGGGETRLKYLDDIVGIATNASAYDGKFLKYDHASGKFEFTTVSSSTDYASVSGIATYATSSGIATYASTSGVSTTSGSSGYATTAGISTVAQGLTGTPNLNVGVVTATTFVGNLTGSATTAATVDIMNTNGLTNVFYPTFVEFRTDGQYVRADVDFKYDCADNILTVSQFAGNLTGTATTATTAGYASTAGISTVSQGLTGTPNITVGVITATDYRIQSVSEKTTLVSGNSVSLIYNTGGGNIAICTNPSGDISLSVTGIPTDSNFDNRSLTFSVIVSNAGTARSCTTVTLNGVSRTIKWFGGSLSAAISGVTTSSGYDIYNFTGINTVGSASTTTNYDVLGTVNGGYR